MPKILVECTLPTDYGFHRSMDYDGLTDLTGDGFYVLNKNNQLVVREYLENGFSCEDKVVDNVDQFTITGYAQGGMGCWKITYRVCLDAGTVKNIYEISSTVETAP